MSIETETDICNRALSKIGGAGDQESGSGFIASINGVDRVSARCKFLLPRVRRRAIGDLAKKDAPFPETLKYLDLGAENASPPETGGWQYAFNLPNNTLRVMKQINEEFVTSQSSITEKPTEYRFETIFKGTAKILLTNTLSNADADSAFVQVVFDQRSTGTYSEEMIECIATLLASELCPTVGANTEKRKSLLAEYKTVSIPDAKSYNQSQSNRTARRIPDYSGGRSKTLSTLYRGSGLLSDRCI
jgi:hypothetical protein